MLQTRARSRIARYPDIGRIGRVVSCATEGLLVIFFRDDLIGVCTYCKMPIEFWTPVPDFLVQDYQVRALKYGWRLTDKAQALFHVLGWPYTEVSLGRAETSSNGPPHPPSLT